MDVQKGVHGRERLRRDATAGRVPEGPLPALRNVAAEPGPRPTCAAPRRGGFALPSRRHHLRDPRRERGRRAPDSVRHRPQVPAGKRVAHARAGLAPARAGAERIPQRRLPWPGDPVRRADSRRAHPLQRPVPPRDAGHRGPGAHLRAHRGHRRGAGSQRRVPRARGQPARPLGCLLHAREPQD